MVVGDGGAARGDEAAALEVSPRHALRRAVISEIETKVLHGRQGERRDGLSALAVRHDVVAHHTSLPVRGAAHL